MSAPTNITQWLQGLPLSWLVSGPVGSKDAAAQGQLYDGNVQALREAVLARFPMLAPSDALPHIGGDRKLIQGIGETNANFRVRLRTAWDDWSRAGTPLELLVQLEWEGFKFGNCVIVQQDGLGFDLIDDPVAGVDPTPLFNSFKLSTLASPLTGDRPGDPTIPITSLQPDGFGGVSNQPTPWWTFDSHTAFCSRFAVIVKTLPLTLTITTPGTLGTMAFTGSVNSGVSFGPIVSSAGSFTLDVPGTFYSLSFGAANYVNASTWTLNSNETITTGGGWAGVVTPTYPSANLLSRIKTLIQTWKPAKSSLVEIIDVHQGHYWGEPALTWGQGGLNWGSPTPLIYSYGP